VISQDQDRLIRFLVGLQGSRFELQDFHWDRQQREMVYEVVPKGPERICSRCHQGASCHDREWIELKDLPVGIQMSSVKLKVLKCRVRCKGCGIQQEALVFRSEFGRITKRLEEYIVDLLMTKMITVQDIARMFGLDYDLVYRIDLEVLRRQALSMKKPDPQHIAVDEKSFKKGHSYVTIVIDVEKPRGKNVIYVAPGRKKESLDEFFKWLGKARSILRF